MSQIITRCGFLLLQDFVQGTQFWCCKPYGNSFFFSLFCSQGPATGTQGPVFLVELGPSLSLQGRRRGANAMVTVETKFDRPITESLWRIQRLGLRIKPKGYVGHV